MTGRQSVDIVASETIHQSNAMNSRHLQPSVFRAAGNALLGAGLICTATAWATLGDYQTAVTNETSLISYYTFDQSNAADVRGTNHGTLMGTTAFATGAAGFGTGLSLGGAGRVNLGVVEDFAFANDDNGSAEAWVKAGNLTGAACIFANRDGYSRWDVHLEQNKLGIGMWNGGAYFPTIPIPNASTNWHHIVVVFDNAFFTVYWDGALAGTVSRALGFTDFTKSTQIGSVSPTSNNSENWVGTVDEVAIYADALTPAAVLAHYQAMSANTPPVITKQPQGGIYLTGAAATLSVQASGPNLGYQWYRGVTAQSGKTNSTLTFPSLSAGDTGTYSVIVSNATATVTSSNAAISLAALPAQLVSYQTAISNETSLISYYTFDRLVPEDVFGANEGTMAGTAGWDVGIGGGAARGLKLDGSGHVDLGTVPAFDFASGVGTVEGWFRADWASLGYNATLVGNRNNGPTVWSLHLNAAKTGPLAYNNPTTITYSYPAGASTNWHHFAAVFTNATCSFYVDGNLLSPPGATLPLGTGTPTTVQIGESWNSSSTFRGWVGMLDEIALYSAALPANKIQGHYNSFVAGVPPVITSQPQDAYILSGQVGQLTVSASGAQLAYQWFKDGALIPGATNVIVGPVVLSAADSGKYQVIVTNLSGSVTSVVATVQVDSNIASYQAAVLGSTSLISYYTFDAGDAQDSMSVHPGTVANGVSYGTGPGGVTNASLVLDGTGHIDLGSVADFDFTDGTGTVEGWVQANWVNPAPYDPALFADRDGGSVWSVHMSRWKIEVGNFSGGYQALAIPNGSGWHHYAIVFNTGTVSMYWDGKPTGSFFQTINSFLAKTTQIGSSTPGTTSEGWLGNLDEVAFYSDALSSQSIWNHYLAMVGPPPTLPTLNYALIGNQLTLSWPTDVAGFTLESSTDMPATIWTPVDGVVNNQVTVNPSAGMQFFRLRK
jgi:hypothetical protein